MAEARHRERKSSPSAKKKEERTLWSKLKGSALFWLAMVVLFGAVVVTGIVLLSKLLSGA